MRFIFIALFSSALVCCAYGLQSTGPSVGNSRNPENCTLTIRENFSPDPFEAKKLGLSRVYGNDSGKGCSEADVLSAIKRDGCSLGADLASLHDIHKPDGRNTCYRVTVDFYKLRGSAKDTLHRDAAQLQMQQEYSKQAPIVVVSLIVGLACGFLALFLALSKTKH